MSEKMSFFNNSTKAPSLKLMNKIERKSAEDKRGKLSSHY